MGGAQTKSVTVRLDVGIDGGLSRYAPDAGLSESLIVNSALARFLRANAAARTEIVRGYVERARKKR